MRRRLVAHGRQAPSDPYLRVVPDMVWIDIGLPAEVAVLTNTTWVAQIED